MHHPTDRIAHTIAYVTPVVEHWLEREIAQWDFNRVAYISIMLKNVVEKSLFDIGEIHTKGFFARDRCALQQLVLNVHIKHSDLT